MQFLAGRFYAWINSGGSIISRLEQNEYCTGHLADSSTVFLSSYLDICASSSFFINTLRLSVRELSKILSSSPICLKSFLIVLFSAAENPGPEWKVLSIRSESASSDLVTHQLKKLVFPNFNTMVE